MEEGVNYDFTSEVDVDSNINQGFIDIDDLLVIASTVWKTVKEAAVSVDDKKQCELLLVDLYKQYHDFCHQYPIVVRWMVFQREFSKYSFKQFATKAAKKTLKKKEDFLEMQADYIVELYSSKHKRCPPNDLLEVRKNVLKQFLEEDEKFTEAQEESKKIVSEMDKEQKLLRRKLLHHFASQLKK